ncbi:MULTISPECIES: CBS domain-containing protein [unclassified Amycolatopsis]|uniref:CBS domain-containing protein n=1 Tax=unclassified Amycolatopsis TaxID=2618356 RepID=UPI002E1031F0|nr:MULTISPECIES: CBS domain-containing protein [unclassified Amycolatopsis]WSJ81638.1 CBS domain-containing protein [Amycolatopsis sp. NBC_01307]WSK74986.1 CBS domain-containing protein [Amycolatopsis sp. NBC_01286]
MHALEMAEEYPVVELDSDALDAARLLAERRLPGLVVTDKTGCPQSVLPASEVVQFLVPNYVRDDPSLAGVLDESMADRVADKLSGKTVRSLLPEKATELPRVNADDTLVEVAAMMARLRCPLVAVMEDRTLMGVISASRLLELALTPR